MYVQGKSLRPTNKNNLIIFCMNTTNFEEWLQTIDFDSYREVYGLYTDVETISDMGIFSCKTEKETQFIVKNSLSGESLFLASEKAKNAFLRHIEQKYCDGMSMEAWFSFKNEMEKEDNK
jgi:hypothetical protein